MSGDREDQAESRSEWAQHHPLPVTDAQPRPCTHTGEDVQLNVAAVLWDLFDGPANGVEDADDDGLSLPFASLWKCICDAEPDSLSAFLDCLRPKLSKEDQMRLDQILDSNLIPE